eukprot:TRINITY_DN17854_c0_g1_i1.p1 TRINITY_DN17854_c0_g1~~TRINITY_DN17854_c0_g1_i1.p1  ORF type:complete len:282 (+),score=41.44 TRINITY_DN17854_c0_g1_i1:35-880(+)
MIALGLVRVLLLCAICSHAVGVYGEYALVDVLGRRSPVYKPKLHRASLRSRVPGIFVLHGSEQIASDMYNMGFERSAEEHNFLVAFPEMHVPRNDSWGFESDIPYFAALVDRLAEDDFRLNKLRTYVCGHSAGGTMSLYLQNQVDLFHSAAAVEAAVGNLDQWDRSRRGHRTLVVWNHADPVLHAYAPPGGEPAYFNLTISTLRRHGSQQPAVTKPVQKSQNTLFAELVFYAEDAAPELVVLSWRSEPGTHEWPRTARFDFSATSEVVTFFLGKSEKVIYA